MDGTFKLHLACLFQKNIFAYNLPFIATNKAIMMEHFILFFKWM